MPRLFHIGSLIAAVILAASACARAEPPTPVPTSPPTAASGAPGDSIEEIVSSGQVRRYRLHIPPGYRPGQPMPLVINLHGYSSNAAQQEQVSGMSLKADQAGFIAVHPEGLGEPQAWHFGPGPQADADLGFIRDLIRRLESQWSIDPARIYATGISNGAQMTNYLACALSDRIAAVGPVSGGYFRAEECQAGRPVPVIAFHGTADHLIPYEGQGPLLPAREWAAAWAARNGCAPTPTVTFQHGQVTGETWSGCREGADVVLYTIAGGGHAWPGSGMVPQLGITTQDINATDVIWEFFAAPPRR